MRKAYKKKRQVISDKFLTTYAKNIYFDGKEYDLPDWVFDYREAQIHKITQPGKRLYEKLNEMGVDFKIKYPVRNFGKWKFADAFLPKKNLVIILMNHEETITPAHAMYERVEFFKDKHRCIRILPEEISKLDSMIKTR